MVTDNSTGEMFCGSCGFVMSERIEELGPELRSDRFTIANLLHRLAHLDDPWADLRKKARGLPR